MSSPTMMPMSLTEIAQAVDGRLMPTTVPTDEPVAISAFTDSRQIVPGSVFVAIAGERVDGHDFVPKVGAQGAVAALVDHEIAGAQVPQIVVENTVKALGALAKHNIERRRALESPFTVIGITGSVGKTTTKDLLKSLLSKMGDTVAPVGSFNNEIGLPLTSLKVNAGTRSWWRKWAPITWRNRQPHLPGSAGHRRGAQGGRGASGRIRLCGTHRPSQIGNRTRTGAGRLTILNANDEHVAAMSAIAPADVLWFGLPQKEDAQLDTTALDVRCDDLDHPSFVLEDKTGRHANVTLGICGQHNVMNALAAATVAMTLGMPIDDVASGLSDVTSISRIAWRCPPSPSPKRRSH